MLQNLQNLQNFAKFQKVQLDNLVDFEKCCKTRIFLRKSVPIQPKTSNILPKFCQKLATTLRVRRVEACPASGTVTVTCNPDHYARIRRYMSWKPVAGCAAARLFDLLGVYRVRVSKIGKIFKN